MVFPILGANTESAAYEIENSLRFNDGDNPKLQITTGSNSARDRFTFSAWVKKAQDTGDDQTLFSANDGGHQPHIKFDNTSEQLNVRISDSASYNVKTNRSFRDPSAWYHIVVAMNTQESTASNRIKIYVNGVQETSLATADYPTQNYNTAFNSNTELTLGRDVSTDNKPFDGYMAEVYYVDGIQYAASDFGEYNNNGVWIPKDAKDDINFGTHGFYFEFKQTGTSANSSGIGADTSGNDNHYTPTNLGARNVVQDTPTNNFMTFNPLYTNSRGTFAEGNCQVTTNVQGSVPYGQVEFGNFHVNSGKWYWEVEVVEVGSGGSLGLGANERAYEGTYINGHNNGGSAGNIRYNHSNGNVNNGSSTAVSGAATYTDDDTIGFAMDLDNNKMYIHKNGTYINSGDPAAGSNGITMTSSYSDFWTPWISKDDTTNNAKVYLNTGNPVIANDSGNADDNGYGDFEYDVPAGFYALCTKNLATYG
jgi:hypothetical protein